MIFKKPLTGFAFVVIAFATMVGAPSGVRAQGVDFLWGGSSEWGGGRQTVAFSTQYNPGQIIVSFGDRRLYLVTQPGRAISYPIAVPRDQSRWQGTTFVSDKRINPSWTPTPTMIAENPRLPRWVPGGHPMNPLGVRALYLGSSTYRIHGTDAPWTIGQAVSKGCVRMYNEDVLDLYPRVPVGARVIVTWQRMSSKAVASSSYEAPATSQKPMRVANKSNQTAAAEPQYEYVNPFEFLFGDAPAPKKKTTQTKKYSSTAAKPKSGAAPEAAPAATSAQPDASDTGSPPAQTSTPPATTGQVTKPADATQSADATAAQKSAEVR